MKGQEGLRVALRMMISEATPHNIALGWLG